MPEIKFRAWNEYANAMFEVDVLHLRNRNWKMPEFNQGDAQYMSLVYQPKTVLMQYTGFEHKGVEIYDKDILRFTNPAPGKKWRKNHGEIDYNDMIVSWNKARGMWAVYWQNKAGELCWSSLSKALTENHAIVGNVYQNKDLVK